MRDVTSRSDSCCRSKLEYKYSPESSVLKSKIAHGYQVLRLGSHTRRIRRPQKCQNDSSIYPLHPNAMQSSLSILQGLFVLLQRSIPAWRTYQGRGGRDVNTRPPITSAVCWRAHVGILNALGALSVIRFRGWEVPTGGVVEPWSDWGVSDVYAKVSNKKKPP